MSDLSLRTLEAARTAFSPHVAPRSARDVQIRSALEAAMDPALGPDRLVVAGSYEQEIIQRVCDLLRDDDTEATRAVARYLEAERP